MEQQYRQVFGHPAPRPAPQGSRVDWEWLGIIFPALTHLYLPGLLIPESELIVLRPNTLVKLSLGQGGPNVPIRVIARLIRTQTKSLRSLHLGNLDPSVPPRHGASPYHELGEALLQCERMEDFRLEPDPFRRDYASISYAYLAYTPALRGPWRYSLKACGRFLFGLG